MLILGKGGYYMVDKLLNVPVIVLTGVAMNILKKGV